MNRNPGLDAARALAMMLVIATHSALSFMVTPIGWAIQDRSQFLGVDLWVWIVRAFAMPTFFWLAGYFSRATFEARGVPGYVRQRATRIALPLVVALVPCSLAVNALWDWGREVGLRGTVAANIPKFEASELPVQLGHLWFLYYLLILSIVVPLLARRIRNRVPGGAIIAAAVAVPAGVFAALRVVHTDTPLGFIPDPIILVHMGTYFAWGWAIHAQPDELNRYARWWAWALGPAMIALGLVCITLYRGLTDAGGAPTYGSIASAAFSVCMMIALLGACVRFATRSTPAIRTAADASYWAYIVHLPIVVLLQIIVAPLALPWFVKLPVVAAIAGAVAFGSYAAGRRLRNTSRTSSAHR